MVVPEPDEPQREEGATSGAAIDDEKKRQALMAKFGEAADGEDLDDGLKVALPLPSRRVSSQPRWKPRVRVTACKCVSRALEVLQ